MSIEERVAEIAKPKTISSPNVNSNNNNSKLADSDEDVPPGMPTPRSKRPAAADRRQMRTKSKTPPSIGSSHKPGTAAVQKKIVPIIPRREMIPPLVYHVRLLLINSLKT